MLTKFFQTLKIHAIKLLIAGFAGAFIGAGVMFYIKDQKEEFWRTKYVAEKQNLDSVRKFNGELIRKNEDLTEKNRALRDDLGVTILAALRSNFYNLRALKSENYNTQMYYNLEEYKSNLVPKNIGEKWNLNVFDPRYKGKLNRLKDSLYKEQQAKQKQ